MIDLERSDRLSEDAVNSRYDKNNSIEDFKIYSDAFTEFNRFHSPEYIIALNARVKELQSEVEGLRALIMEISEPIKDDYEYQPKLSYVDRQINKDWFERRNKAISKAGEWSKEQEGVKK